MTEGRFTGRVALVTGGSSGIGRATALAFAREGARVMIASRGRERGETVLQELASLGAEAEFVATDVSRPDEVEHLVRRTVERFGRLDCAFNNAATLEAEPMKPLHLCSEEDFDRAMAFNLRSVFLCMRWEIEQMLSQGGGAIVNTSSVNGLGGVPGAGFYAAAKAAVLGLTKSAALELAGQRIRVNALVAGGFLTPMLESVFQKHSPDDPGAAAAGFARQVPLGRIGAPEEAAEAVLWLCSDAASYMTGNSLIVDGGVTAPYR
jgi:NAD(P)-dependent dehydrogenase (short-subunit alcohol dehydrogenase family)